MKKIKWFQRNILARVMSDKAMSELEDMYEEGKMRRSIVKEPSDNDKRIMTTFLKTKSLKETANSFKLTPARVMTSVLRATAWAKNQ